MPYTVLQAQTPAAMVDLLNGVVRGDLIQYSVAPDGSDFIPDLNGKTLEFTLPLVTVTFATANPVSLAAALGEINTQVQAADVNFIAYLELAKDHGPGNLKQPKKRLVFQTDTAAGIHITGGTARDELGFASDRQNAATVSTTIVAGGDNFSGGLYVIKAP